MLLYPLQKKCLIEYIIIFGIFGIKFITDTLSLLKMLCKFETLLRLNSAQVQTNGPVELAF